MNQNRPIRVAQIMGKFWAGGVETVVFNYYRKLDHSKIQFDFYYDADSTVEPPQDLIEMGAYFYKIPPYQKLYKYLKILKKHFREKRYTIVCSHINTLSVFPLYIAWLENIPVRIAHNHSVPGGNEIKRNILKYILRSVSKIFPTDYFACSEKAGRWMFGDRIYAAGQVNIIRNAIDFEKFKLPKKEINYYRRKLGLENKFVVGHIGRFTYAKNHAFLIAVFSAICKVRKDAALLLVGDGELHDDIISEIKARNLENRTILIGMVSNPEKYYALADVIVLPSIFEGLSLTTVESQAAGVPIVISEAIPKEAIISNGCIYESLAASPEKWAITAINAAKINVCLNKRSKEYDINRQAIKMQSWYLAHSR